ATAAAQRLDEPGTGRLDPADHFDDDIHVVAFDQAQRVRGEDIGPNREQPPVPVRAPHTDPDQLERRSDPGGQIVGLVVQQPYHPGADNPAAEARNLDRTHAPPMSNARRSSSVSRRTITRTAPSATATTGGLGTWL